MNNLIIIGEGLKKLNLNKQLYKNKFIFNVVSKFIRDSDVINVNEARKFLCEANPKPTGKSSSNNILVNPVYDLKIIVPAYNVEKYIDECLLSILNQKTDYSFKVVVINDGSTDRTEEILEKYKSYKNVEIINQKNRGFSGARNTALKYIDSKYLMFVDSDDKLADNAIQLLMESAFINNSEIVEGSYYKFKDNKLLEKNIHTSKINVSAFNNIRSFPWGKVIKSSLFKNICFPEGFWYEDTIFMYLIFPLCNKATTIKECVYLYRYNQKGITATSKKNKKCTDTYWILESMLEEMNLLGIKKDQNIYEFTLYQILNNFRRIRRMDIKIQKSVFLLSVHLINNNFLNFKTNNNNMKELEKALRKCNFTRYYLYCSLF